MTTQDDFLQDVGGFLDSDNDSLDDCDDRQEKSSQKKQQKPKWWRQLSQRRGTKAQRRATAAMVDNMLKPVPYGTFIDFEWKGDVWYEIGFGLGDNLLCNAQRRPDTLFLGAEVHKPGAGTLCGRMQQAIQDGKYWDGYTLYSNEKDPYLTNYDENGRELQAYTNPTVAEEPLYSNVCIHPGDGMTLLRHIPASSLSAVLLTFPDPFPKNAECRFLQQSTGAELHRVLRKGGRFYLATDHEGHFQWCKNILRECTTFEPVSPVPDRSTWLPVISKYEQKGWEEGRKTMLAVWEAKE